MTVSMEAFDRFFAIVPLRRAIPDLENYHSQQDRGVGNWHYLAFWVEGAP